MLQRYDWIHVYMLYGLPNDMLFYIFGDKTRSKKLVATHQIDFLQRLEDYLFIRISFPCKLQHDDEVPSIDHHNL